MLNVYSAGELVAVVRVDANNIYELETKDIVVENEHITQFANDIAMFKYLDWIFDGNYYLVI